MTKIALRGPVNGTGSYTLRAPETADTLELELPTTGTHLASADASGMPLGPGGDPVVASGSNTDGNWTKWSDGTMHVSHQFTGISIGVSQGSVYTTGGVNSPAWIFPIPFIETAHAGSCTTNNVQAWGNITLGATGTEWRGFSGSTQGGSAFRLFATGRWK